MAELSVSKIESDDKSHLELKCDLCRIDGETVDGVIVCVDCIECLCKACLEVHLNNEVFKGHKTVTNDNLPVNFTSQTLHELKDMIFCGTHEVQFEYHCEDHAQFVCQPCMKKVHRSCKRITKLQNVHISPQSVLSEIQEIRNWFQEITKQRTALKELESVEKQMQMQLKTTILEKMQSFIDQDSSSNKKEDHEDDTESLDLLCDDVKRVIQLHDRYEELLDAVLHLNDTEMTVAVSRRVELSLIKSALKENIDRSLGRMGNGKKISDRLKVLETVTNELLNASHWNDNGDLFNRIIHTIKETTNINAEVQRELYQDTQEEQLQKVCVTEPSSKSSDVNTNPHAAVREPRTFKDAEVQTEDASDTCSTISLGPCTTEYLTASADVDTEPVYVTGPCTSQQSDSSSVIHGRRDPDNVDDECQTPDNTHNRDSNIPLFEKRLEHIGAFNVCSEGGGECAIAGIIVLHNMRIALLDRTNKKLMIYDGYFNFQMSYRLKWRPVDICVADYDLNRVAISFDSRRIETYEVNEDIICYKRGFYLSLYCRGLYSMSSNTIAVLVSTVESLDEFGRYPHTNSKDDDIEIQIRDINNGRIIHSIDTFGKKVIGPAHILQDHKKNIIIGEQNQVSAFDRDGDRLWNYKSYKGSKLEMVVGMAKDPEGNIYVCSCKSNSIHQVSSYNYMKHRVIIPHVPSPNCVAYDPHQKRLIVGSYKSKSVNIYRFV